MSVKKLSLCAVASLAALSLAACGNSEKDSETKVETATSAAKPASAAPSAASTAESKDAKDSKGLSFDNGFVKAKGADKQMTGIFGMLHNNTDKPAHLVSFTSSIDAPKNEIHEVVNGVMQEKPGGIEIPAGGTHELKPGSDHLMLMGVTQEISAGDTVKVTLKFQDGTEIKDVELPVRAIGAGEENYGADGALQGNNGMSEMPSAPAHNHG